MRNLTLVVLVACIYSAGFCNSGKKQDIMIVMDGSASLRNEGWNATKAAAHNMVSSLLEYNENQVGLMVYSGPKSWDEYNKCTSGNLQQFCNTRLISNPTNDKNALKNKIDSMVWPKSTTMTSFALRLAQTVATRNDASYTVILITDGVPFSLKNTKTEASKLKKWARLIVVPVGNRAPLVQAKEWATRRWEDNILIAHDWNELKAIAPKVKAAVCPSAPQPGSYIPSQIEQDVFKLYDVMSDQQLDTKDMDTLASYIHIWEETKPLNQADNELSSADISKHTKEYQALWDGIVNATKRMRVNDDDRIEQQDFKILQQEITEAKANLELWLAQMEQMKINLKRNGSNPNAIIEFTIQDVINHANSEVDKFTKRITNAFDRLRRGNESLPLKRVQTTKAYMGLMLGLMKNGATSISYDEYMKNLKHIDDLAVQKLKEVQNARATLNAGRMGKEKLSKLGHENATYSKNDFDL